MSFDPEMIQEIIDRILDLIIGIIPMLALTRSIGKNVDKALAPKKPEEEETVNEDTEEGCSDKDFESLIQKLSNTQELIASFSSKIHRSKENK